jgi:hypothetical protein
MSATLKTPCELPSVTCRQRLLAQAARRKAWRGNTRPGQAAQDGVRESLRGFRAPGPRDHRLKTLRGGFTSAQLVIARRSLLDERTITRMDRLIL